MATFAMFVDESGKTPEVSVRPINGHAPKVVLSIKCDDGDFSLHCRSIDDVYAIYHQLSSALAAHEDAAGLTGDDTYVLATPAPVSGVDGASADPSPFPNEVT